MQKSVSSRWESLSRNMIVLLAFLLPFWFLPIAGFNLSLSKSFLVSFLVLASLVFYIIHLLQSGTLTLPKSWGFIFLSAIILVSLVSSLFSENVYLSFFGAGSGISTFFFIFLLFALFFLVFETFQKEKYILLLFFSVIFSSFILFLTQVLNTFFGITFGGFIQQKTDSLIGSWSELAIFFGFVALISIVIFEFFKSKLSLLSSGKIWRIFLFATMGVSFLVVALVNFASVWITFASFILVFFVYQFSSKREAKVFTGLPFFVVLISLFFILAQPLIADIISGLNLNYVDVRPSWQATFEVSKDVLTSGVKNLVLGTGPNTFALDWVKFKPSGINQTMFWNSRFGMGIGLLPSFVAMSGLLGVVLWMAFLAMILYYGFKIIGYEGDDMVKGLLFTSFLGSVYLWVFNIIYPVGYFLFFLSFLVTGVFFALLIKTEIIKTVKLSIINNTSKGFAFGLVTVFLLIIGIAGFYMVLQKYYAASLYGRGIESFNFNGDLDKAQNYIMKAASFDSQDSYYRSLSEIGLIRVSNFVNQTENLTQDEIVSGLQSAVGFAIQNAQTAVQMNDSDPINWFNMGQVYENLAALQIEGAKELAVDSYAKALEKGPYDPLPLFSSARVEFTFGNNEKAREFLQDSLGLKSNYTSALYLLARIAAEEGNLDEAIRQTELARLTAPNDVGVLFQLGMLYYQKEDNNSVIPVLERAVVLNPEYSNARYFLGLAYDNSGKAQKAIEQFEYIKQLNPDNAEVEKIISNLKAGKPALTNVSPPDPAPEEREELPIEEE